MMTLKTSIDSLFGSVDILTAYIAREPLKVTRGNAQYHALAAISLSCKLNEAYPPDMDTYLAISGEGISKEAILKTEEEIFLVLGNVSFPSCINFLRRLAQEDALTSEIHSFSKMLACTALITQSVKYPQNVIACAVHYLVTTQREINSSIIYKLADVRDIKDCSKELVKMLGRFSRSSLKACETYIKRVCPSQSYETLYDIYSDVRDIRSSNGKHLCEFDVRDIRSSNGKHPCEFDASSKLPIPFTNANNPNWSNKTITIHCILGHGTYGVVKKVSIEDKYYALKKTRGDYFDDGIGISHLREIACLMTFKHEGIVAIHGFYSTKGMILEMLEMTLKEYTTKNLSVIKSSHTLQNSITKQLLSAISYIHQMGCLHRDLKPQNILISCKNGDIPTLKVCDFGVSRGPGNVCNTNPNFTSEICTLWYRPPEILLGCRHQSHAVDIWSLACVLYEFFTNMPLFPGDAENDQLKRIFMRLGTPDLKMYPKHSEMIAYPKQPVVLPPQIDSKLTVLLERCLVYVDTERYYNRPSASTLIATFYPDPITPRSLTKPPPSSPTKYEPKYYTPPKKTQARTIINKYMELIKVETEMEKKISIIGETLMFIGHTRKGLNYFKTNQHIKDTLKALYEEFSGVLGSKAIVSETVCNIFS